MRLHPADFRSGDIIEGLFLGEYEAATFLGFKPDSAGNADHTCHSEDARIVGNGLLTVRKAR
ncbi:MAG: hypothetical protein OXI81_08540 [Paracoccaceae bacterium]|nr:hypothetical protein [Paracoccaceae bacterium]